MFPRQKNTLSSSAVQVDLPVRQATNFSAHFANRHFRSINYEEMKHDSE